MSSTEAAIIYTLEPVFGAAFAYYLLGERWGMSGWVGAALIVTSCLAAQLLGALARPGVVMVNGVPEELPLALGDGDRIAQARRRPQGP